MRKWQRALLFTLVMLMAVSLTACGGPPVKTVRGGQQYNQGPVELAPPLIGEGKYRYGKPPEAFDTGGTGVRTLLASWCWPRSASEIDCGDVGWPPKLPSKGTVRRGQKIPLNLPEMLFPPSSWTVRVNPLSAYTQPVPGGGVKPAEVVELDPKKDVKLTEKGLEASYTVGDKVPDGDWVLAVSILWDNPIGGNATWLLPITVTAGK